ncbi:hypothetical protein QOZ80_3BG0262820 [Eleusine coracana subsp. coracana]|nr:hypothetical protein QOZ80_3BG0262820 [Eleusine coracana subsp. coracana]
MPPAVVPVLEEDSTAASAGGGAVDEKAARHSCHVAWWANVRCLLTTTILPCHGLSTLIMTPAPTSSSTVGGTLFLPSTGGDRRVRLFLQNHDSSSSPSDPHHLLVLDLPASLGGADVAAAGRIVLECRREWGPPADDEYQRPADSSSSSLCPLLESPRWTVYCNGRRQAGYAARRGCPSDAEGWAMETLRAVTAGAGRLPGRGGGGVEYLRGRFHRVVGSPDAESFHLVEPVGWPGVVSKGGCGCDGGLSIFFHRV